MPDKDKNKPAVVRFSQQQLDVIIKKHENYATGRMGGVRANLAHHDLSSLSFAGKNMADADFTGAQLHEADFSGAKLDRTTLFCADLRHANLRGASLNRADLRGALLRGANLVGASMAGVDSLTAPPVLLEKSAALVFLASGRLLWMKASSLHNLGLTLRAAERKPINIWYVAAPHRILRVSHDWVNLNKRHKSLIGLTIVNKWSKYR
jgi:uncharacterized protein YjbI with pentapeptide repeats